jgi:hypothetical protein
MVAGLGFAVVAGACPCVVAVAASASASASAEVVVAPVNGISFSSNLFGLVDETIVEVVEDAESIVAAAVVVVINPNLGFWVVIVTILVAAGSRPQVFEWTQPMVCSVLLAAVALQKNTSCLV